jgi:hypothetical protein
MESPGQISAEINSEAFVADLYADWQVHGPAIIARVREEKPADFLKIIASLLPKDINLKVDPLEDLDDATLAAVIEAARQAIALAQSDGDDAAQALH